MKIEPLCIRGAYRIEIEPVTDDRGFFARTWCADTFAALGLSAEPKQCSLSFNARRGTLRGMHWQAAPFAEAKLVRCTQGALYDVLLDLRSGSPTCGQWTAVELTAVNRRAVYVPEGVAHGFQTLVDGTEALYLISEPYRPEMARGVRWDDPAFGIAWPDGPRTISERDLAFPDWQP
ncbi:MAG TPA: dTDP-4-dehydrorhamnose 3,5-epimerase family protein [Chthonomonadaceae bacterium]|nr:dTDP-4-dehydrorhamnose 3,5-epimerase family protein [Chthonomonadaceae bacterium]